jgi:hypothetical protein
MVKRAYMGCTEDKLEELIQTVDEQLSGIHSGFLA